MILRENGGIPLRRALLNKQTYSFTELSWKKSELFRVLLSLKCLAAGNTKFYSGLASSDLAQLLLFLGSSLGTALATRPCLVPPVTRTFLGCTERFCHQTTSAESLQTGVCLGTIIIPYFSQQS